MPRLADVALAGWDRLAQLVLPPRCVRCLTSLESGREGLLCQDCRHRLAPTPVHRCPRCGASTGRPLSLEEGCLSCHRSKFHFDRVLALGSYSGDLQETVLRMKLAMHEPLTIAVGRLLAQEQLDELRALQLDAVVPVPMHWTRRWRRATNGPELLAAEIARALKLPCASQVVVRARRTRLQSSVPMSERSTNVRGAFRLRRGVSAPGLRLLVVDDILTTGATTSELARVLKQAGASAVHVAIVARTE